MTAWTDQLQPASFRGIPFFVTSGSAKFGRRNAVHEYPYRDTVWVEDIGRSARRISLVGFVVGDDAIAQRNNLIAACEKQGDGQLIHPTLGALTVSLLDFNVEERDQRVFEVGFRFIEAGKQIFPSNASSTGDAVTASVSSSKTAAASLFVGSATSALKYGNVVIQQMLHETNAWARQVTSGVNDATSLYNTIVDLPESVAGIYGRYFGGSTSGSFTTVRTAAIATATVDTLISQGSLQRSAVANAAATMATAAANADAATVAAQAQALADLVIAAAPDPADAIRLLQVMANYATTLISTTAPIGSAISAMASACADLFRRAAVIAMAEVGQQYQPASQDDALTIRTTICSALDAEAQIAGDQGADDIYVSLRATRTAVSIDLAARGAALPSMRQYSFKAALPADVLAQRIYRDPTRADELTALANPVHPAFMPLAFKALSS